MLNPHARRTIGLDVDGVLLDIHTPWLREYTIASGHQITTDDLRGWNLYDYIRSDWCSRFDAFRTPALYLVTRPIPGAVEGVRELARQGHRLVVVTHDTRPYVSVKRAQLARFFPDLREFVFTDTKGCVKTDVLIDDAPHNVAGRPGGILLSQPWNMAFFGAPRVAEWQDIPRLFAGC